MDTKNNIVKQQRCFLIDENFITCNNCQLNYDENNGKTFCQEFSCNIDPHNILENMKRAQICLYWHPDNLPRQWCHTNSPEHERWYEKDSMG